MRSYLRLTLYTTTIFLTLAISAIHTVPAYADGETPPVEPPVATEPVEPPTQDSATEGAANPTPPESVSVTTETPVEETASAVESTGSILAEIPQGTELIVLNATGESVPLAAEEAAQAILEGDPMWCPAGVTPGSPTCTSARTTFSDMLVDLAAINGGLGPNMAGVIWIHKDYNSMTAVSDIAGVDDVGVTNFTLNGSTLTNMANFALTIQGGWTGTGKTIDTTNPSEFVGASLNILNWKNAVTLIDIAITSNTTGSSLLVTTTGNITTTRVNVSGNSGGGAFLDNEMPLGTGNVTVTASQFNNNTNTSPGLRIDSLGTITLKDVIANGNGSGANGRGIELTNNNAVLPKAITLTNITASDNRNYGIFIQSKGLFTGTDLTAINNGLGGSGSGFYINNATGTAGVTLNGTNLFFSNTDYGLDINSSGAIKLNNIHAIDNGLTGAQIDNDSAATPQAVTLTGTNSFKFNGGAGVIVYSLGQITSNNITANSNITSAGAYLYNYNGPATSGVTLTGTNIFSDNDTNGLYIQSAGTVTINNITANGNGLGSSGDGLYVDNSWGSLFKGVTLTGVNTFNDNKSEGLQIISEGIVTLNNLNANGNTGNYGVRVSNTLSTPATPKAVSINGTNIINNNSNYGLYIQTHGAITANNLTASFNSGGDGAYLDNATSTTTPANITLNGVNTFNGNFNDGLYILTLGTIKANAVNANDSVNGNGASFNNNLGASTNGITLTGTNTFTANKQTNLVIYSNGAISLNNVTASNSVSNGGAMINNSTAATPKTVVLSGTNNFSGNWFFGLTIDSLGAITANSLNINGNGVSGTSGYGASLTNNYLGSTAGVTLTGSNALNNNYGTGLQIGTYGNIKLNNITASGSLNSYGAYLDNGSVPSIGSVTLTGTNNFSNNKLSNLEIYTIGAITINNLTASGSISGSYGAYITHSAGGALLPKPFTLTGTNVFNNNSGDGLYVSVYGAITTNNLSATGNGTGGAGGGVYLTNESAPTPAGITVKGTNIFTANEDVNLIVRSKGAILANNVTASGSISSFGGSFNNGDPAGAVGNVTLTGVNNFSGNFDAGMGIASHGSITINNVTASNNGGDGVRLDNTQSGFATPKPVTLTGFFTANNNTGAGSNGLQIYSYGAITTNNVTASNNTGYGANIDNNEINATIPSNVTMNSTNSFFANNNTGLYIDTLGNIVTNNVTSTNSVNGYGTEFYAESVGAVGAVTMKGTNTFSGNFGTGLYIDVQGVVSLNNINASNSGVGVYINNAYSGAKPVTLTGTNAFNNNANGNGLQVFSNGVITTNNLTANNNGTVSGTGVALDNDTAVVAANVILKGTNTFNGNYTGGLEVYSLGNITLNNITANNNLNSASVFLDNDLGASTTAITLTGINNFSNNQFDGLRISSNGAVTLSKVTADGNGDDGLDVTTTTGTITLTCGSFINNTVNGVLLITSGNATLTGVISAGNSININTTGVTGVVLPKFGCPLP